MSQLSRSLITLLFMAAVLGNGCKSEDESKKSAVPAGMVMVDLSAYGKPFSISVPDTSTAPLSISEEQDGALNVRSGRSFGMSIYEQAIDIAAKKEDIRSDEVNRLSRIVKEDAQSIIWESAITEPEFHFVRNARIAGRDYSFCDIPGTAFGEEAVKTMDESAANAQEKSH